jgi:hypothetical protein
VKFPIRIEFDNITFQAIKEIMKGILKFTSLVLLYFSLTLLEASAQTLSLLNRDLQYVRIGLVDEFFKRFNGKTAHPDIPIIDSNARMDNLMFLFDLAQFTSKNDPKFQEATKMMDVVIRDSIKINYFDTSWVAIAHCRGLLEGKRVNFDLFLTVQHRKENMYKWVIARAEGNIFNISPRNENEKIMLNPGDHETNFMSLGRMSKEQPFNVKNFLAKGVDYDMTSVFAYLIYNRKLKIDYVNELEFVFTQVPGYIFHIKYFERENKNSGWLISDFYKSTEVSKSTFIGSLFPRNVETSSVNNVSQNNENLATRVDTIVKKDTVDYKTMFNKRLTEKIAQLQYYIKLLQGEDTLRSFSVYQSKIKSLLIDSAKVYLQYKKKTKNSIIDVPLFCDMLIRGKVKFLSIDSLCIPVWNDKINSLPIEVNKIELDSSVLPFESVKEGRHKEIASSSQKLFAYKEETEDGIEWIPIIGDIIVKVK